MGLIWPGAIVGDNTLAVHAAAIRKAFGPYRTLLKTDSGRGYRLLGNWTVRRQDVAQPPVGLRPITVTGDTPITNFPATVTRLVGRSAAVMRLRDLMSAYRIVTVTGSGGIGKTTLALKTARRVLGDFSGGGWLVELASLSDPDLVPSAVAHALGLKPGSERISAEVIARDIGSRQLLLVLDNCEHVIDAAATLVEMLVRLCPHATILATSREALRVDGEFVYRLPPLDVPAPGLDRADLILDHSAVELFIARATAMNSEFSLDPGALPAIGTICRQLDGIPLAIELAAARATTFGIELVADGLRDRFALLTGGRRTAMLRHRTLRATLDWSHDLLVASERVILRRLSIFAGSFSLMAACAVVAGPEDMPSQVVDDLSRLVAKSLVVAEADGTTMRYRLLDTMRSYAREKLDESGERGELARRHADYYRALFEQAEAYWDSRPTAELLSEYGRQIDNLRMAIDWAFSPGGDASLGIALTAAAIPLWMHLSLLEECRGPVERAIAALAAGASEDTRLEMKLHAALGAARAWVGGAVSDIEAAWARALQLAEILDDVEHQLRSLWGLWLLKEREALTLARQFFAVAPTAADRLLGERMIAVSSHYLGDQNTARHHIERVIANDVMDDTGRRIIRFQIAQRSGARAFLGRILWLQGFPDQAIQVVTGLVEQARAADHANSLCHSLAIAACPIALWVGDLEAAEQYIDLLRDYATRHGLSLWRAFGMAYQGVLSIRRGDVRGALPLLRGGFDQFGTAFAGYRVLIFLGELAGALGRAGQIPEGLGVIDDAIERSERSEEGWVIAELLRVKGELVSLQGTPGAAVKAELCFHQALDWAKRQNALSWQLRVAMSLAQLLRDQHRFDDAIAHLQPVYDRFTEGFETADLKLARALLANLK